MNFPMTNFNFVLQKLKQCYYDKISNCAVGGWRQRENERVRMFCPLKLEQTNSIVFKYKNLFILDHPCIFSLNT